MGIDEVYSFFGKNSPILLILIVVLLFLLWGSFLMFGPPSPSDPIFYKIIQITYEVLGWIWIVSGSLCALYFLYRKFKKQPVPTYPFVSIPFAIGLLIFLGFLLQMLKLTGVL